MIGLKVARTSRDAARASFDTRLALVRGDLAERSVGGRIADKIVGESADVALEAVEIVENHKIVVAGTLAAIVLWFARNPLIAAVRRLSRRVTGRRRGVWS